MRRPVSRTPSLTHTNTSISSSANSTPRSNRSLKSVPAGEEPEDISLPEAAVPLPPSNNASPVVHHDEESRRDASASLPEIDSSSMDITEAHISPVKQPETDEEGDVASETGESQREPTFTDSSSGSQSPPRLNDSHLASGNGMSPAPSLAMTPTPAFPRPRARFSLAQNNIPQTPMQGDDDDGPATPHTRRKSFLLSVINSTTRPRMKAATPFVRRTETLSESPESPPQRDEALEPEPTPAPSRMANLQTTFAGVTPRPRIPRRAGRLSHPLMQTFTAGASDSESQLSPHEGASFVSTASSHDLTTNPRANTSFDPAMGFAGGAGATRFNAAKLNNYLHGLNRRLQEENEVLVEKLRQYEENGEINEDRLNTIAENASRRWSGGSGSGNRRASSGRGSLGQRLC